MTATTEIVLQAIGSSDVSALAKTGDPLSAITVALVFVVVLAAAVFFGVRRKNHRAGTTALMLVCVLCVSALAAPTMALGTANLAAPSAIQAIYDPQTGTITVPEYVIENTGASSAELVSVQFESAEGASGTWICFAGGTEVYRNASDAQLPVPEGAAIVLSGEGLDLAWSVEGLDDDAVAALVGASLGVATLSFEQGSDPVDQGTAFAVYSADDRSLAFDRAGVVPEVGQTHNGKVVTSVYTGFEEAEYDGVDSHAPWFDHSADIKSVSFDARIAPISTANWFLALGSCTSMDLTNLDTSAVTNMESMFYGCSSVSSLDLSGLDTSKVTSMLDMFSSCFSLASLDLSGWDTSDLEDMSGMFYNCHALTSLDLSGFDTAKVADMSYLFRGCYALVSLDLPDWNTSRVVNMSDMFGYCSSLSVLDLSSFDTTNASNMDDIFDGMTGLGQVTLGEHFSFVGDGSTSCVLPAPDADVHLGADGKWHTADGGSYYPAEVPSGVAATYYAVLPSAGAFVGGETEEAVAESL